MFACQQETTCILANQTHSLFSGYFKILTRARVLTVTHHEPEPGWTRGVRDLTDVLSNRGR